MSLIDNELFVSSFSNFAIGAKPSQEVVGRFVELDRSNESPVEGFASRCNDMTTRIADRRNPSLIFHAECQSAQEFDVFP